MTKLPVPVSPLSMYCRSAAGPSPAAGSAVARKLAGNARCVMVDVNQSERDALVVRGYWIYGLAS